MEVVENITPSEEEAMFEEMAADYGEAPAPVAEEKPKKQAKKKKEEEDGHKQTNLFDF